MGYRILSLDGGGSWALIEVRALIELYSPTTTGHEVLADFNLVAGNSGGSQVLAGLLEDLALKDLLAYYQDEAMRRSLFSPTPNRIYRWLNRHIGIGPAYSTQRKLEVLQEHLPKTGSKTLAEAAKGLGRGAADIHLLIIGFDYDTNRSAFFRSTPTVGPGWGHGHEADATLVEAIHASTNAPVNYFDGPAILPSGGRFWDGGITGCNNPSLAAVTEAIGRGQKPTDIVVLSLGTGTVSLPTRNPKDPTDSPFIRPPGKTGLLNDIHRLATSIMDDPPDVATFLAHVMTGGDTNIAGSPASRVVRMNPKISPAGAPGAWGPPGKMTVQQFKDISTLAVDALEQKDVDKIAAYAELWLAGEVPNQPIREDTTTMKLELGSATFKEAASLWQALKNFY
jgi:Patatin-like phospholipase